MRSISANEVLGYFWIIIVLFFVILLWLKVNSILFTDERCVLQSGLECKEKQLSSSGGRIGLDLTVKNNLGRWIQITGILCSSETPDPATGRPKRDFEDIRINSVPGSEFQVSGTCYKAPADTEGGHFKGIVYLRYEYKDEPYLPGSQIIVGNIIGAVR